MCPGLSTVRLSNDIVICFNETFVINRCITMLVFAVPPNGLVIYCGTIVTDEGKEKKVNIDFEPFRPINTSLYLCDNKFHTEVGIDICVLTLLSIILMFQNLQNHSVIVYINLASIYCAPTQSCKFKSIIKFLKLYFVL